MTSDLLSRILTGEANEEEKEEFYHRLGESKAEEELFYEVKSLWLKASVQKANSAVDDEFNILWNRIKQPSSRNSYFIGQRIIRYAAMVLFALIIGGISGYFISKSYLQYADSGIQKNSALKGSVSIVELADGTKIWLNSGSKLTYRVDHKSKQRLAELTGEGYFEIAHREDFPFLVKAGNIVIRDLGTTFNIKAYPEDKTIETSLVDGKADILCVEGNLLAVLKPGESATYSTENNRLSIKHFEGNVLSAWRDGKFVIRDQRLEEIFLDLGRWYDVDIRVESQRVRDFRYTGTIKKTTTVLQILKMLKLTAKFNYSIIEKPNERDVIIIN
jgi:ferric-dicitrate binding protein FerR (iron transport regulator)